MKELLDDVAVELLADELHVVVRDAVGLDVAAALHVAKLAQLCGGMVRGLRADMGEEVTVQAGERDVALPFVYRTVLIGIIHQFYQPALRTAPGILRRTLTHQPVIIFHQLLVGLQFQIAIFFVRHHFMSFKSCSTELSHVGEVIEVKGSYHSFQSFGKLKDNGFLGVNP